MPASIELHQAVIEGMAEGIVVLDRGCRFHSCNPAAERMLGFSLSDYRGQVVPGIEERICRPDGTQFPRDEWPSRVALRTGKPQVGVILGLSRPDGSVLWLSTGSFPLFRPGGDAPYAVVLSLADVTARVEAEQALAREEHRLAEILRSLEGGVWSVRAGDRSTLYTNPAVGRIYGRPPEEFTAHPTLLFDVVHPDDRDHTDEVITGLARTGFGSIECRILRPDGSIRWTVQQVRLSFDASGAPLRIDGLVSDVTEKRQAEAAIARATEAAIGSARTKSEFLANVSHELRTPLNGIAGNLELALGTPLTEEQREYLQAAADSAFDLTKVVGQVLDFASLEAGHLALKVGPISLREVVAEAVREVAPHAEKQGLGLFVDLPIDVPDVRSGDRGRFLQILNHLLDNAIKFTASGHVILRVAPESGANNESALHVSVEDSGAGIPPDKLGMIFEAFTQLDGSATRRFGGTGLGLAIVSQLVYMMGGRIWVESEPGVGSTFHFTVQLPADPSARALSPSPPLAGSHVLLVSSHPLARRMTARVLSSLGARTFAVDRDEDAALVLGQRAGTDQAFTAILIDSYGDTAGDLIARMRAVASPTPPVLLLTSRAAPSGQVAALDGEPDARITRPLLAADLLAALRALTRQRVAEVRAPRSTSGAVQILLVEDNVVNQKLATRLLNKRGYVVAVADNGRRALAMLGEAAYDLVLMDLQMPEMDGFEATAEIRRQEATTGDHIPIIALTAHAMRGDRERCLEAGMDEYISKPIDPKVLFATIDLVLAREEPARDAA